MRVLVTGGAGFIGSHVVDHLIDAGHDVVVVDRRRPAFPNPGARYHRADLVDAEGWAGLLRGVDAVSHQAAKVGLGLALADVTDYVRDNDVATAVLLRELDRVGFSGRLVVASSMVVYGDGSHRCPACGPVRPGARRPADLDAGQFEPRCPRCGTALEWTATTEDAPVEPRSVYAATKAQQEHLCAVYGREAGVPVIALRYHNVYGPRCPRDTPYAGVASIFLSALRRGEAPAVYEDGGQQRDFVHVADVARANLLALQAPPDVTGAYNIASGRAHSVLELATALWTALGGTGPEPVVSGRWRAGDVRHVVAAPDRARHLLGFEAHVALEDGMAELASSTTQPATTTQPAAGAHR